MVTFQEKSIKTVKMSKIPLKTPTQLFIDNEFVDSLSKQTFNTYNPSTEELLATVSSAQPEDIDLAVLSSGKAFDSGPWRRFSASERGRLLYSLSALLLKNSENLINLEILDGGISQKTAEMFVYGPVSLLSYYAGFSDKIQGTVLRDMSQWGSVLR